MSHARYRLLRVRLRAAIALVSPRSLAVTPKGWLSGAGHFSAHSPTDSRTARAVPGPSHPPARGPATLLPGLPALHGELRMMRMSSRCLGGHAPRCPRATPCSGVASPLSTAAKFINHPATKPRPLPLNTPGPPGTSAWHLRAHQSHVPPPLPAGTARHAGRAGKEASFTSPGALKEKRKSPKTWYFTVDCCKRSLFYLSAMAPQLEAAPGLRRQRRER